MPSVARRGEAHPWPARRRTRLRAVTLAPSAFRSSSADDSGTATELRSDRRASRSMPNARADIRPSAVARRTAHAILLAQKGPGFEPNPLTAVENAHMRGACPLLRRNTSSRQVAGAMGKRDEGW